MIFLRLDSRLCIATLCVFHSEPPAINHPSGDVTPSQSDRAITKRLVDALSLVDIRVLDHLIVGREISSLAELGYL